MSRPLKSYNPIILTSCALALSACAGHSIQTVSPGVYQIRHSTGVHGAVKGIRSGITQLAIDKCASENNAPMHKLREEITPEHTLTYILTFECKPGLQTSTYTGSQAENISASIPSPNTQPKMGEEPISNTAPNQ